MSDLWEDLPYSQEDVGQALLGAPRRMALSLWIRRRASSFRPGEATTALHTDDHAIKRDCTRFENLGMLAARQVDTRVHYDILPSPLWRFFGMTSRMLRPRITIKPLADVETPLTASVDTVALNLSSAKTRFTLLRNLAERPSGTQLTPGWVREVSGVSWARAISFVGDCVKVDMIAEDNGQYYQTDSRLWAPVQGLNRILEAAETPVA